MIGSGSIFVERKRRDIGLLVGGCVLATSEQETVIIRRRCDLRACSVVERRYAEGIVAILLDHCAACVDLNRRSR